MMVGMQDAAGPSSSCSVGEQLVPRTRMPLTRRPESQQQQPVPRPAIAAIAMPPKKNQSVKDDNVLLLGRIGTNLKVGIVGLPNVGSVLISC